MDAKQQETVTAIQMLQVGSSRYSELTPPCQIDRIILTDRECHLIDEYIQSQIRRLELTDQRINELEDMLGI